MKNKICRRCLTTLTKENNHNGYICLKCLEKIRKANNYKQKDSIK